MEAFTPSCERARLWASLALDGELSELERAALDEHLRGCAGCRAFAAGLGGLAAMLRAAPLEQPLSFELRRPRVRRVRPALVAAGVAVVLFAAGLGSLAGTLSSGGGTHAGRSAAASQQRFIEQQLLALANGRAAPHHAGHGRVFAS